MDTPSILKYHRYYDKITNEIKVSGLPNDKQHNSLYKNLTNKKYNQNNYKQTYQFPKNSNEYYINKWYNKNRERRITYIIFDGVDYKLLKVRISRYDKSEKKLYFC
tara:strand:+ start:257 stop:574 length:318 start_codon:yes stop_codon:yes gene_type:complete